MSYMERWCDEAISYIRFPPDREAVKRELLWHMEDKRDAYEQEGLDSYDAEQRAIRDMGPAKDTGLLLRKIHRPYLGWLWRISQWALAIALILAFFAFFGRDRIDGRKVAYYGFDMYGDTEYESDFESSRRVGHYTSDSTVYVDGYRFRLKEAVLWHGEIKESEFVAAHEYDNFWFRLEVFNPRPWAVITELPRRMTGVDSLGNVYSSWYDRTYTNEPQIAGNPRRTGLLTCEWDMWAENYVSQEAEWLELRYNEDGRNAVLRIDLTGGEPG